MAKDKHRPVQMSSEGHRTWLGFSQARLDGCVKSLVEELGVTLQEYSLWMVGVASTWCS